VTTAGASGQEPRPPVAQQEAMKKLDFLVGRWQGESWTEFAPGQKRRARGSETVERKLDGLLLTIEGRHRRLADDKAGGAVVHNAFAVVSYDDRAKRYRFQAYTGTGQYADAEAKVADGRLEWSMQVPGLGHMRYTITVNDKGQWSEVGEMSRDGKEWRTFFGMTLDRVKEP
jgi:hypothetical protein